MSTGCPPSPLACPPPGSMKATGSRERPRNEVPEMPVINRDLREGFGVSFSFPSPPQAAYPMAIFLRSQPKGLRWLSLCGKRITLEMTSSCKVS